MSFSDLLSACVWKLSRLLPIQKDKIVVTHFYGRGYGDNPKAIVEALLRRRKDLNIVWLLTDPSQSLPEAVHGRSYGVLSRIYQLSTAKVWIDDCRKGARQKRKGQIYLQTWHGFALKRIEGDTLGTLPKTYEAYARRDAAQTDLMISGSDFMEKCYRRAFWYTGEIACYGSPRNDILFHPPEGLKEQVYSKLGISPDKQLVLYAPTFRADGSLEPYSLDPQRVIDACEKRFGGRFALLLRLHPNIEDKAASLHCDGDRVIQATHYPDLQELLALCQVVITDYSSLMFDFALTGRPVFQFATDIAAYRKDRNFNFPLDTLPFSLAQDNDELEANILHFEEATYKKALSAFFASVGMREDGHAAERCADWILNQL
jgi:CDP-glycerol glycerophosphotransferase